MRKAGGTRMCEFECETENITPKDHDCMAIPVLYKHEERRSGNLRLHNESVFRYGVGHVDHIFRLFYA